jgi:ribosomal-protein-serine acetyltransferase
METSFPVLKSEAIELRTSRVDDAPALYALTKRNETFFRQWLPWLDSTRTEDDTKKHIERFLKAFEEGTGALFTIYFEGAIVGLISFNSISKTNKNASIGYWLDQASQGKGIVTKACALLIEYGFHEIQLHRIELRCAVHNEKSCAIPKRLGFVHEGVLRDAEWLYDHFVDLNLFSLLSTDWKYPY